MPDHTALPNKLPLTAHPISTAPNQKWQAEWCIETPVVHAPSTIFPPFLNPLVGFAAHTTAKSLPDSQAANFPTPAFVSSFPPNRSQIRYILLAGYAISTTPAPIYPSHPNNTSVPCHRPSLRAIRRSTSCSTTTPVENTTPYSPPPTPTTCQSASRTKPILPATFSIHLPSHSPISFPPSPAIAPNDGFPSLPSTPKNQTPAETFECHREAEHQASCE